jgi:hypothetical protein
LDGRRPSPLVQAALKAGCGGRGGRVGAAWAASKLAAGGGSVMSAAFSGK